MANNELNLEAERLALEKAVSDKNYLSCEMDLVMAGWLAARSIAAPAQAEPSGALPELPAPAVHYPVKLWEDFQMRAYAKQAIEARGGALPAGLAYAIERAINKARTPGGQHTNGPTYASLEVSQLEYVLRHCILGQQGGGDAVDAARYRFARDNGYFSAPLVQANITYERATDIDFGIDALIQAQAGDAKGGVA